MIWPFRQSERKVALQARLINLTASQITTLRKICNGANPAAMPYIDRKQLVEVGFLAGDPTTGKLWLAEGMKWRTIKRLLRRLVWITP